ncbi:FadR/GntR family transcriptional regulator [Deinococcus sp.]|uniref:FadR/GntR family transcriptional regulator n=1 Tax=Deinococcus sp. TaxID=47478 RepID=UPI003CC5432D
MTSARPSHETIASRIVELIQAERLQPGDRLPTERELSQRLEVSRSTVRDAVKVLGAAGLVQSRQGSGLYLLDRPNPMATAAIDLAVPLDPEHVGGLFEFRESLETQAAFLAAERITLRQLRAIEEAEAQCMAAAAVLDVTSFRQGDQAFHQGIAEATGAPASYFAATIATVRRLQNYAVDFALEGTPGSLATAVTEHARVLDALRHGDASAAQEAMRQHIRSAQANYQTEVRRRLSRRPGEEVER